MEIGHIFFSYVCFKMEGIQARVQDAVNSMLNTLDKDKLRKMQGDMYRCSATCCDSTTKTLDQVQRCVDSCSQPINKAQSQIQEELQVFQNRLQRCAMDCQDNVRDKVSSHSSASDVDKYKEQMESCVLKCAETNISTIPNLLRRMKEVIAQSQ